jgi:anti-anti-sigma factor
MNEKQEARNHPEDALSACMQGDKACLRVHGRGSFKVSTTLKRFADKAVADGIKYFQVDLDDCIGMDSTFMGVLAGLATSMKADGIDFFVVNISDKNRNLLHTLGIDQVIKIYFDQEPPATCSCTKDQAEILELETGEEEQLDTAETMLEAHKNLTDLNRGNIARFKNVIDFLEEDVRKLKE